MTTSRSPLRVLQGQADAIAKLVKAVERGETVSDDRAGKLAAARTRESVTFGVVMDDRVLNVEMTWAAIRQTSEAGISAYLLGYMRDQRETLQ